MISIITFLNLKIIKAKYEKGKISVPGELRHVCMSEVTKANVTFLKYLIQMASGTGYMGSYCMTHTNPSWKWILGIMENV